MTYIPLRIKSSYSLLSSLITIDKLVEKARNLQIKTLALTDYNNMYGVMEFINSCQQHDLNYIIGVEFNYKDNIILLYAKSFLGYQNLNELVTICSQRILELADLQNYCQDLLLILPTKYYNLKQELEKIFSDIYYGYETVYEKETIREEKLLYLPNIIILEENDYQYLEYLYKIKENQDINDVIEFNNNHLTIPTMYENKLYEEIENKCHFAWPSFSLSLPQFLTDINETEYLESLAVLGLKKRFSNQVPNAYYERLKYELKIIKQMGFENYFLIVFDFVRYAKKNHILVGPGRGSAAGSLVSYSLGITNVDPLKYGLYFERFLNPERVSYPDIDIDFDANKRDLVIDYVRDKYGIKNVAEIITFGTLASRQVLRDVGKALDIGPRLIDDLASMVNPKLSISDNYIQNYQFKNKINSTKSYQRWYEIALKLEGLARHTSKHAAGVVMAPQSLTKYISLKYDEGVYLTGIESTHLEELGLLKMDFLGLKNLSMIDAIVENVYHDEKIIVDLNNISEDDNNVLTLFYNVNTLGIFQFESSGMKNFLRKLKLTSFNEIVAALALYRPGPMGNIDLFIARKLGTKKVNYLFKELEPILEETNGIMVYQEQIMKIAQVIAAYSLGEADILRKAMAKKKVDLLSGAREDFVTRAVKKGYDKTRVNALYDEIFKFAGYGFPKAHSVAYAKIAYQMAYLKYYYPLYFYTYLLDMHNNNSNKIKEIIIEARNMQIPILYPNINKSKSNFVKENQGIRFSLSCIKGLGVLTAKTIVAGQPFNDIFNFVLKTKGLNQKIMESLILSGCFDCFGYNRKTLMENLDNILNYALLNGEGSLNILPRPLINEVSEYSREFLIQKELELFGFYLTIHPVNRYKKNTDINLDSIDCYFDKVVSVYGLVENFKIIDTKNKSKMAFLTISDETAFLEVTIFEHELMKYNNIFKKDIVKVTGKVEKRFDKYQVIASKIEKMTL